MAYEYQVGGRTVRLDVDPNVVAVKFDPDLPKSARAAATESTVGAGVFARRYEVPGEELTLIPVPIAQPGQESVVDTADRLTAEPAVENATPVFRVDGNHVVPTDRLIVGVADAAAKADLAARYGLTELRGWDDTTVFQAPAAADVFALARQLDAEPATSFAEPDFVTIGRHIPRRRAEADALVTGDPLLMGQYAMRLTRAVDAWQVQSGDPAIRVAILDEGVDTNHPDLKAAVVAAFDAVENDAFQDPNAWDGHGTACAGLAAAVPGNGVGIRGVAGGCSIVAVRIAFSRQPRGNWVTSNEVIARAIRWAWDTGKADVLSNSWGGGAPSGAIIQAFARARAEGRGGKGAVVVIAAGNDAGPVSFPGNLPDVLTVAASNHQDEAKTKTSSDGEDWWGTCHGPEIDVAAPGVFNLTTDNSAGAGYDPGDYAPRFNGTSSATPIVAGACALVLSANPAFTEAQVRATIKETADKVGGLPYDAGRNDFFGHGRLNVLAAVQAARARVEGARREAAAA